MKRVLKLYGIKQLLCIALSVVLATGFMPLHASAYSTKYVYKITTVKQNTPVVVKADTFDYDEKTQTNTTVYQMYKITLPSNGYIKAQVSSKNNTMYIYKSLPSGRALENPDAITTLSSSSTYYKVLPKGTYYIRSSCDLSLKWSFTKINHKSNYCRAKAASLKKGKKAAVVFDYGYEYAKWYKIKLTKKKKITVTKKVMDTLSPRTDLVIYNSRGVRVQCSMLSGYRYQTAKLPKGTYYIMVLRSFDRYESSFYEGRLDQITWK